VVGHGRTGIPNGAEVEVQGGKGWSHAGDVVEGTGSSGYTLPRRGGRVVECGGLENRYVGNPGVGGSNPPLSAALRAAEHAPRCGARSGLRPALVSTALRASSARRPASLGALSACPPRPAVCDELVPGAKRSDARSAVPRRLAESEGRGVLTSEAKPQRADERPKGAC
jgi:hypothetical protein